MRVTIIRDDNLIIINGRTLNVDLSDMPADLHAVQWYGDHGEIERVGLMNQTIDALSDFQVWIERWDAAAHAIDNPEPPPPLTAEQVLAEKKRQRQALVDAIVVTTSAGHAYNGDETSQGRMARAILTAQLAGITECTWVLANNTPTVVTLPDLQEALMLSMQAQDAVWVKPYL